MKRISMQQKWIITLVFFTLLFLVLLVIIFRQNRKLDSAYKYLFEKSQRTIFLKQKTVRGQHTAGKTEKADERAVRNMVVEPAAVSATTEKIRPSATDSATTEVKRADDDVQKRVNTEKTAEDRENTYNPDTAKDDTLTDEKR